jgi:hypothetical protein
VVRRDVSQHSRVVTRLPRGADVGRLYAASDSVGTRLFYPRFWWLRDGDVTYGDLFEVTVRAK